MSKIKICSITTLLALNSLSAISGEVTLSPTIKGHLHYANVSSDQDFLSKNDAIYGIDTEIDADYLGPWFVANGWFSSTSYNYNNNKETDLSYIEHAVSLSTGPKSEQVSGALSWRKEKDLFNTVQGSFSDKIFAEDNGFMVDSKDAKIQYEAPKSWDIDAITSIHHSNNRTNQRGLVNSRASYQYSSDNHKISIGQYSKSKRVYWRLDSDILSSVRNKAQKYKSSEQDAEARIPLINEPQIGIVGTYQRSVFENPSLPGEFRDDEDLSYQSWGVGGSWRSQSGRTLLQLTRDYEIEEKKTHISGKMRFAPTRESQFEFGWARKFFGSSYYASSQYLFKDFKLNITYGDKVELRYILSPERLLSAIFLCPGEMSPIDTEACLEIKDINTDISPTDKIVPVYRTEYPLSDRLSLNKTGAASLVHQGLRWTSSLTARVNEIDDLEYDLGQDTKEISYNSTRGVGRRNEYSFTWKYRELKLQPSGFQSNERLYSVAYKRNLNRNAHWSVTLQHINQSTSTLLYDYKDNRISLQYVHHFGVKNKRIAPEL